MVKDPHSSGTAGSFLKAYSEIERRKIYYKLSNFDSVKGVTGHECVNELIVDRLLNRLGIEHLHYDLVYADIIINDKVYSVYLNASEDFRKRRETKIAFDAYYALEKRPAETPLEFCIRSGWEDTIYSILVTDYLILNRDRHGANLEVLRNSRKRTLRLAPLFDHGLSLLFNCATEEAARAFDVLADLPTNTYIGSRSTRDNLTLIPQGKEPVLHALQESDRAYILDGLEQVLPAYLQDRIWEMLWKRWCAYEDFLHSR